MHEIKNPKRPRKSTGRDSWYPYYAGFSEEFVSSAIDNFATKEETSILDPWNGSGTTTCLGNKRGYNVTGFDLNPVMVIAAKAKLIQEIDFSSIKPLAKQIISETKGKKTSSPPKGEPLEEWFVPNSAASFRQIEYSLQKVLVNSEAPASMSNNAAVNSLSSIACFFYVALFRSIRTMVSNFESSNPTWIKRPSIRNRLRPNQAAMLSLFSQEVNEMLEAANEEFKQRPTVPLANISVACSSTLPLANDSVDLVVTSPPYCTRIDYAMATLPELTLLGYQVDSDFDSLRRSLIGSSTVSKNQPALKEEWGTNCCRFLAEMAVHESKASATYYYKNHVQYFDQMYRSIAELNRVVSPAGKCLVVVQDSYYKNIHNDLAQTFTEMFSSHGMSLIHRQDFVSGVNIREINSDHKKYGTSKKPLESVLCFEK